MQNLLRPLLFCGVSLVLSGPSQVWATEVSVTSASQLQQAAGKYQITPLPRPASGEQCLSLSSVEGMALANNPTLIQLSSRVQAARGRWLQAGLRPNPSVGYESEGSSEHGVFVGQEFVRGNKLQLSQSVVTAEIAQAEQQLQAQHQRVLNDVGIKFYEVLVNQQTVELSQQLLTIAEQGLATTEELFRALEVSRIDVLQARVEMNTAKVRLENARNTHVASWRQLAAVMGCPEMPLTCLEGNLHESFPELQWHESLTILMQQSPELSAARSGISRSQRELQRAIAEPVPNFDMRVVLSHDTDTDNTFAKIEAGIPLPWHNRNQGNILQSQAQITEAEANLARVELDLQHRLATAFVQYQNSRNEVHRFANDILPDAKTSLDLTRTSYQQGEVGFLMLLTAQRTYFQTNIIYLDAVKEYWRSIVYIEGLVLDNSLSER